MPYAHPETLVSHRLAGRAPGRARHPVVDASYKLPRRHADARGGLRRRPYPGCRVLRHRRDQRDTDQRAAAYAALAGKVRCASQARRLAIGNDASCLYGSTACLARPGPGGRSAPSAMTDVAMLDGGCRKWQAEGRPLDDLPGAAGATGTSPPASTAAWCATRPQVLANIADPKAQVLDARAEGRFEGTAPEPAPVCARAIFPAACTWTICDLVDAATGTLKPAEAISAAFEGAGVDLTRPVVTTCGSGVTASVAGPGPASDRPSRTSRSMTAPGRNGACPATTPVETGPARR